MIWLFIHISLLNSNSRRDKNSSFCIKWPCVLSDSQTSLCMLHATVSFVTHRNKNFNSRMNPNSRKHGTKNAYHLHLTRQSWVLSCTFLTFTLPWQNVLWRHRWRNEQFVACTRTNIRYDTLRNVSPVHYDPLDCHESPLRTSVFNPPSQLTWVSHAVLFRL